MTVSSSRASQGPQFEVSTVVDQEIAIMSMGGSPGQTLSAWAFAELERTLRQAITSGVKGIVLTGQGRAFCFGADLSAGSTALTDLIDQDGGDDPDWLEPAGRLTSVMRDAPVPVVAAVNGDAVGGGATLTLGADVRLAVAGSRFGFGFGRIGVVPEGGSTWLLPRLVGLSRATEWMLSGRMVSGQEALVAGLVSEIVEDAEELIERSIAIARTIGTETSPRARQEILRLLSDGSTRSFDASRAAESRVIRELSSSVDAAEGMSAFVEGRAPKFNRIDEGP